MSSVPPGTPYMANPQIVTHCLNPGAPELCPSCCHVTLFRFTAVVFYDDGVAVLDPTSACGEDDCPGEE